MVERGEDLRFALEASHAFRVFGKRFRQDFQRHLSAELGIGGAVHRAHSALAQFAGDAIV